MTQFDAPRLATIDDDGWSLQNAEERFERADNLYWLPDRWIREHLEDHVPDGGFAKLLFMIHDAENPRAPVIERMWVTVSGRDGTFYHGHLANEPYTRGTAKEGMPVWFNAEHVIDYGDSECENRASEQAGAIECGQHGLSHRCYVCEHLTLESDDRGFHTGPADTPRPDAWCDQCHEVFLRAGENWEAAEHEPKIRLVCGGCYDRLKLLHS
jgi:hypothetical protein